MKVLHECLDNDSPHLICKHCGAVGRCEKDDPPMPPQTKALALALAILREHNAWHIAQDKDGSYDDSGLQEQTLAAIHALEQEAPQPVQAAPSLVNDSLTTAAPVSAEDALTQPMVVAAARELCRIEADECHTDYNDGWKVYGDDFLRDAKRILRAALAAKGESK